MSTQYYFSKYAKIFYPITTKLQHSEKSLKIRSHNSKYPILKIAILLVLHFSTSWLEVIIEWKMEILDLCKYLISYIKVQYTHLHYSLVFLVVLYISLVLNASYLFLEIIQDIQVLSSYAVNVISDSGRFTDL